MDSYPQNNRPVAQAPHQQVAHQATSAARAPKKSKKKLWVVIIIVVVVLLALGCAARYYWMNGTSQIDSSKYQAVFLSNGQVYFGKIHDYYTDHPYLTNVYYIQAQNGQASTSTTSAGEANQQLVKLGGEIHAPENEMILNKQSILFVENLTNNGKVVKLIESGK